MTSPAEQAPAPAIQTLSGLCCAILGWLATNLPQAIRDTVLGFVIGYAGNVFLMLFLFDGYTKTQSGLATGTTTVISGSLTWGIGTAIVTSLLAYRRRVGKEQFWRDIRGLPAVLGSLLKADGRLGRVHLLSGACISLLTTCFVAPWASLVLAAGLLAIVPSALRAVLSNLLLSIWSSVANRLAPAHANPVGGAMAMTVGTLGAILALGAAFLVPSSLIKIVAAAVCGGLAWADSRRMPPSAAIWILLGVAGALSGVFVLLDPLTALAHDGGWAENHRSLITWWNSAGSTPLLGYGVIGGVASGVGSAIGSAIGSVLSGVGGIPGTTVAGTTSAPADAGAEGYTPGVIYGTGSKEDPFRDYKDAAHPPWMAPYGDGSVANPYSDTPPPVIDTSPTPGEPAPPTPSDQPTTDASGGPSGETGATNDSSASSDTTGADGTAPSAGSTSASGPGEGQESTSTTGATGPAPTPSGPTSPEPPPIPQGPVVPPPLPPEPVTPPTSPPEAVTSPPGPTDSEPQTPTEPKEAKEPEDDKLTKTIEDAEQVHDKLEKLHDTLEKAKELKLSPEGQKKLKEWAERVEKLDDLVKSGKEKAESLKEAIDQFKEVQKDIKEVVDNMTTIRQSTMDIDMDTRSAAGLQAISAAATTTGIVMDKIVRKTLGNTVADKADFKKTGKEFSKDLSKVVHAATNTTQMVYDEPEGELAMGKEAHDAYLQRVAEKKAAADAANAAASEEQRKADETKRNDDIDRAAMEAEERKHPTARPWWRPF